MPAETAMSSTLTDAINFKPHDLRAAGRNFQKRELVIPTTGVTSPSYYGFFRLPANAVITSAELSNAALSTSAAGDIGLWETSNPFAPVTQAGSVANAKQYFGAAVSLVAAAFKAQLLPVAAFQTLAKNTQMIWQVLGLTADPQREYDVVLATTTTVTAGGVVMLEIAYKLQ